MNGVFVELRM